MGVNRDYRILLPFVKHSVKHNKNGLQYKLQPTVLYGASGRN